MLNKFYQIIQKTKDKLLKVSGIVLNLILERFIYFAVLSILLGASLTLFEIKILTFKKEVNHFPKEKAKSPLEINQKNYQKVLKIKEELKEKTKEVSSQRYKDIFKNL